MASYDQLLLLIAELQAEVELMKVHQSFSIASASFDRFKHELLHPSYRLMEAFQQSMCEVYQQVIQQSFPDNFVFNQPKVYVGGDFYWAKQVGNKTLIVVGDCVGHGVEGANISFYSIAMLNELFIEGRGDFTAGDYVRRLDEIYKGVNITHGLVTNMGLVCCIIDKEHNEINFSNHNGHFVLVHNKKLTRIRRRAGLGSQEHVLDIQNDSMSFSPGDCLYLYTDGYHDQFGGERGTKFMRKRLEAKLLKVHQLPMIKQKNELELTFNQWMAGFDEIEQNDDVLMLGLKL